MTKSKPRFDTDTERINAVLMRGTRPQRETLLVVVQTHPAWFRSRSHGERVTLAALYDKGVLTRRAYRGAPSGDANAAFEYALSDLAIAAWSKPPRADDPRPAPSPPAQLTLDVLTPAPFTPLITVEPRRGMTACSCCGAEDGTVKQLKLGCQRDAKLTSATNVALCKRCRGITAKALEAS